VGSEVKGVGSEVRPFRSDYTKRSDLMYLPLPIIPIPTSLYDVHLLLSFP
jgi:hypothetical protein